MNNFLKSLPSLYYRLRNILSYFIVFTFVISAVSTAENRVSIVDYFSWNLTTNDGLGDIKVEHSPIISIFSENTRSESSLEYVTQVPLESFSITSTVPARNAQQVVSTSNIELTFSSTLDLNTVNATNIVVVGEQSDSIGGTWTVSGTLATFNPTNDLPAGEVIHVEVSANVQSSSGSPVTPDSYSFTVAPYDSEVLGKYWLPANAPEQNRWRAVAYGAGKFVAVAENGTNRVMYSTDGESWTPAVSAELNTWTAVTYGNGKFVAVSDNGDHQVMYSEDGITWTSASAPEYNYWRSITYGNGRFVAVARTGTNRVMYSDDGINWVGTTAAEGNSWVSVTYGNGKFVAVSTAGANRVMYSTNGESWTAASATEDNSWQSVTYGNGKFVAVASSGTNMVMYSEDGISWSAASSPEDNDWNAVAYGNGKFVAVSTNGSFRIMYSADGINWTRQRAAEEDYLEMEGYWMALAFGNGRFVGIAPFGKNLVMHTYRPILISSSIPAANAINIAQNASIEVTFDFDLDPTTVNPTNLSVVGEEAGPITGNWSVSGAKATFTPSTALFAGDVLHVESSPNIKSNQGNIGYPEAFSFTVVPSNNQSLGQYWASSSVQVDTAWQAVAYGNGRFVAVSSRSASRIVYSTDGINWITATAPGTTSFSSVTFGNGMFVAVGGGNTGQIYHSTDGASWTLATLPEVVNLLSTSRVYSVTFGKGKFVAVGDIGDYRVVLSEDGINWKVAKVQENLLWRSITYGNGKFVAVSTADPPSQSVMYSTDGEFWTGFQATNNGRFQSITYGNGKYVAVGSGNSFGERYIAYSTDAINWTEINAPQNVIWNSVAYGNGKFVALSEEFAHVMISDDSETWKLVAPAENNKWRGLTYAQGKFVAVAGAGINLGMYTYEPITVSSITPSSNATNVPQNTTINLTFDSELDASTVNSTTLVVRANKSGSIAGSWSVSGAQATFTPTSNLPAGEVIYVETTANVKSSAEIPTASESFSFTVAPSNNESLGQYWTVSSEVEANTWNSVAYGNGTYVVVAGDGTNRIMYSSDAKTWTAIPAPTDNSLNTVIYADGKFVASGSTNVILSNDGITWTNASGRAKNSTPFSLTYGNGQFVGVSSYYIGISNDGDVWNEIRHEKFLRSIVHGNGIYVALGSNRISFSKNALTWTDASGDFGGEWRSVTYGNGKFVAVASSGTNRVKYSTDGMNWTAVSGFDENAWYSVTFGNGVFVAVAYTLNGNQSVMVSTDGMNWSGMYPAEDNAWGSVTYGDGKFVSVARNGENRVMYSFTPLLVSSSTPTKNATNVASTTTVQLNFNSELNASTVNNSNIVVRSVQTGIIPGNWAVSGTMATFTPSAKLPAGEVIHVETTPNLQSADGKMGLSQGLSFTITSEGRETLGKNWKAVPAAEANAWTSVAYGNGKFVAVANSGTNRVMYSTDGESWTPASATEDLLWSRVSYGNGRFVASASNGTNRVMYSDDGVTWTIASQPEGWSSLTYGNGRFVGVASGSGAVTSIDGDRWTSVSVPEANQWQSVAYGNGVFVAVSLDGTNRVMYSKDGVRWSATAAAEANSWVSVTYGNGKFVAVANSGTNRVMYSIDGMNWTAVAAAEANSWTSVAYGNGKFIAVSNNGTNRVMLSTDGITWTVAPAAENNSWLSVAYGDGRFVTITAFGTNRVMLTSDPRTSQFWVSSTVPAANATQVSPDATIEVTFNADLNASTVTNNNLMLRGEQSGLIPGTWSATGAKATFTPNSALVAGEVVHIEITATVESSDGRSAFPEAYSFTVAPADNQILGKYWKATQAVEANVWSSVAFGNGKFVAVASYTVNGNNSAMYSSDGDAWTVASGAETNSWQSVTYGNGKFVAVASSGTHRIMKSTDGSSWSPVTASGTESINWQSVTYGNGRFVAVGNLGTNRVMYSVDGETWTASQVAEVNSWSSVTYGNGRFVAISGNSIIQSTDGEFWTKVAVTEESQFESITYGNGKYVAVGNVGTNRVIYSSDGFNWSTATAPEDHGWLSVSYGNGKFIAVALSRVMYSADGITWTTATPAAEGENWRSVTYGDSKFVAVSGSLTNNRVMYTFEPPFTVSSSTPVANASNVAPNATIELTFDSDLNASTVTTTNIVVRRQESGAIDGNWSVSAAQATFTPTTNLPVEEVVVIEVSANVLSSDGRAATPFTYSFTVAPFQPFTVSSTTPVANAINVASDATIALTFDSDLNASTVTTTNIVVRGQEFGAINGNWSVNASQATFTPTTNLPAEEVIVIEVSANVLSSDGRAATPFTYSFTVASLSPFSLSSTTPVANATNVASDATIELTFDSDLNASTVTSTNIVVRGQQSGPIAGSWSVAGPKATFDPTSTLSPGEVIHVEVSANLRNSEGRKSSSVAYSFTVAPANHETLGQSWTIGSAAVNNGWRSITYGNGRFVAISGDGDKRVMYSDDGVNWTAADAANPNLWFSITYGNGRFVAVSADGDKQVMYSDDGISWTEASAAVANQWFSVTYGNGRFVAVSGSGTNQVMYSTDGETWTSASAAEANQWASVTYGNGRFVAIAASGSNRRAMISLDGETWTASSPTEESFWLSITYGNGKFVAIANSGTNQVMYSTDGVNWTATAATEANPWYSVTYRNGTFVAVAIMGTNTVMYSKDGISWTAAPAAEASFWTSVVYGNGKFVAVAADGTNRIMYTEIPNYSEVTITGTAGWRMLSSPKSGFTVADISDNTAIQGIAGGDAPDFPASNFYTYPSNGTWSVPASVTTPIEDGYGFITKFFNNDQAGSSPLPLVLSLTGKEPEEDVVVNLNKTVVTTGTPEQGSAYYTLLGNPYASNLKMSALTANGDGALGTTFQIWDNAASDYEVVSSETGILAPWQGFWAWVSDASSATTVTIPQSGKTTDAATGSFFKAQEGMEGMFTLQLEEMISKPFKVILREGATLGLDRFDAAKLTPLSDTYAIIGGRHRDVGGSALRAIEALPTEIVKPVVLVVEPQVIGKEGEGRLQWSGFESFPEEYSLRLTDLETGEIYDLRDEGEVVFTLSSSKRSITPFQELPTVLEGGSERFIVTISGITTSTEFEASLPTEVSLKQNYPNPFNPSTQIQFELPTESQVRLSVYDMLGREVVRLVNKVTAAGKHTVTFDASGLTSGIYIYQMGADGLVLTRKMTLIK